MDHPRTPDEYADHDEMSLRGTFVVVLTIAVAIAVVWLLVLVLFLVRL